MRQARRKGLPRVYKCRLVQYLDRVAGLTLGEIIEVTGFRAKEVQDLLLRRVHPEVPPIDEAELERRAKRIVERLKQTSPER